MFYALDENGTPVEIPFERLQGALLYKTFKMVNRRTAFTSRDGIDISTVFLCLDHGYGGTPLLWETMILNGSRNGDQFRYSTLSEAILHHKQLVLEVFGDSPPPIVWGTLPFIREHGGSVEEIYLPTVLERLLGPDLV